MKIEEDIDNKFGVDVRLLYHQILVYQLYLEDIGKIDSQDLPPGVLTYLKQDFERIVKMAKKSDKKDLTFDNFQFFSYIEKLCFRCFPVGNHNMNICGFPQSLIFKQSFLKKIDYAKTIIQIRGNYPLFELHYNPYRLRLFNYEGWNEVFSLAAESLLNRKDVKGVFGVSWFFDPAIKDVSPEICYIRELIEKIGGRFFLFGSSEKDKNNAFYLSKVRKHAYEQGKYDPTSYMMIIPRSVLLKYYGL